MDISKIDLEGKTVILDPECYRGDENTRTFHCTGGFGCRPGARGTGIFGKFSDGEECRVERFEIISLATPAS